MTSSAGSATLGDISWAIIILQLGASISWGDTAHTLLMGGAIGVETSHKIERKSLTF